MKAKTLMVQGTASNVGKSILTAALCRIFKRKGLRVAPFKAQNMSNNSYVTKEGGEIGRAQAVQAEACGIEPSVLMNPILLKPSTDQQAQVVVLGKPYGKITSIGDPEYQKTFKPVVLEALEKLRENFDLVVIEGAGSPVEMNLKDRDIVNMGLAREIQSPVILVGDINWGGIFAQLVGTYELFEKEEKELVRGFIINKFRGDLELLSPGLEWIETRTGKPVFGVLPLIKDLDIAQEDSLAGYTKKEVPAEERGQLLIDILRLPRISNFTDFDPLKKRKDVVIRFLREPDRHARPDLIIIPGTKSTIADLEFLRKTGLDQYVIRSARSGVPVLGICGGYQMLGQVIEDPDCVESQKGMAEGLGLLPVKTSYKPIKKTEQVEGIHLESGSAVRGYEIHMGRSFHLETLSPMFRLNTPENEEKPEGVSFEREAGGVKSWTGGTYVHGLFDSGPFLEAFLNKVRRYSGLPPVCSSTQPAGIEGNLYDRLADTFERHLQIDQIEETILCESGFSL